jgi:hypothetical protein
LVSEHRPFRLNSSSASPWLYFLTVNGFEALSEPDQGGVELVLPLMSAASEGA